MVPACPKCDRLLLFHVGGPSRLDGLSRFLCRTCSAQFEPYRNRKQYALWFAFAGGLLLGGTVLALLVIPGGCGWLLFLVVLEAAVVFRYGRVVFSAQQAVDFPWPGNANTRLRLVGFNHRVTIDRLCAPELVPEFNTLIDGVLAAAAATLGNGPAAYRFELVVSVFTDRKEVDVRNEDGADRSEIERLCEAVERLPTPQIPWGVAYFELKFFIAEPSHQAPEFRKV